MSKHKIAVIRGDGIGIEVVGEALKVLEVAGSKFGIEWTFDDGESFHPYVLGPGITGQ